jgi:hypothetical protein
MQIYLSTDTVNLLYMMTNRHNKIPVEVRTRSCAHADIQRAVEGSWSKRLCVFDVRFNQDRTLTPLRKFA